MKRDVVKIAGASVDVKAKHSPYELYRFTKLLEIENQARYAWRMYRMLASESKWLA